MKASAPPAEQLVRLTDVTWGGDRFVAVGAAAGDAFEPGTILHSVDGDQWTTASETAITYWFFRVAHGGTHFIAIAWNNDPRTSKIVRSTDGNNWKEASDTDLSGYLEDAAYGANRFVAVGEAGKIIHSPDGDRWTDATTSATSTDLLGVAWNGTRFVAVGQNGTIVTSP